MTIRSTIFSYFLKVCLLCTLIWNSEKANGQTDSPPYLRTLVGASGQLAVDSSRTVEDSAYFNRLTFPAFDTTVSISNIITLYVDETSTRMPPDSFKVAVTVRIYFYNKDSTYDSVVNKKLLIEYNKARTYNNKAVYYFQGAHRVKVKVDSITASYVSLATLLPFIKLENAMIINRIFTLDCQNTAVKTVTYDNTTVSTKGELNVSWSPLNGAAVYDLEWTFVDQAALDSGWYNTGGVLNPDLIFADNATRVTIGATQYYIPLLYEGDGKLFFRVRAAQTTIEGERKATHWSSNFVADGGLGEYTFTGHESALNWQASTSFAEDGKRKSVVQYFDGTLRNRQTVTKDNTTDSTLTAETFYDKQGRGVIQVLPVPTLSAIIKYTPQFNKAPGGVEYDKEKYDSIGIFYCDGNASKMDSSAGAAKYYSYNNPNKLKDFNKFIPRASGYPFTEVKYTQDNSGRIASQGGVGPQFQLNSGHETKYYYGTPAQSELDALFGTEAGYASHYQKNMVRDANGQYSVSYVDMHGRTVATALAGKSPDSLQALDSYAYSVRKDSLVNKSNNVIKGNTIESSSSLLIPIDDTVTFKYALNAESLKLLDKSNVEICYDCLYDLTITVTDECNNQSLPGGKPFVFRDSNMRVSAPIYDTTCTNPTAFTVAKDTFKIVLKEGSYLVTKKLTLREDARDWYRDSLYAPHNTIKTKDSVIKEQLALIRAQRAGNCVQESEPSYIYEQYREQMMLDMTPPYGQYADYPLPDKPVRYNIFAGNSPVYKSVSYSTDAGDDDPAELSSSEFVNNFQPEWAEDLIIKHPEYRKLVAYESYKSSYHWDDDFERTDTYAAALAKGYLNPTNSAVSPASTFGSGNDSLYLSGLINASTIYSSLSSYKTLADGYTYSLWAVASIMGHCTMNEPTCLSGYRTGSTAVFGSSMCEGEKDMAWRFFRDEYLRIKHKAIDDKVNTANGIDIVPPAIAVFVSEQQARDKYGAFMGTDSASVVHAGTDSMNIISHRNCVEYTKRWWLQLASCNYNATDSAIIMPRLVDICVKSSDYDHPFGATTLKPGQSNAYNSFEEVITEYNKATGRSNDVGCNAFLMDAPGSYNKPIAVVNQTLYSRPDSCTCDKITGLRHQYENAPGGYSSFSDYIQQRLHTTIADSTLSKLDSLCNGTISCRYIPTPIVLPPALQCSTGYDVCVDCNQVNAVYTQFKATYPGVFPTYADTIPSQHDANTLFGKYMNSRLGFSKTAVEYLTFLDTCHVTVATTCDTLQNILAGFDRTDTASCTTRFTSYFNLKKGTSYTFNKIDSIYLLTCGKHVNPCILGNQYNKDTLTKIVDSFYVNAKPGKVVHTLQTQEGVQYTNLVDIAHNGIIYFPDSIRAKPSTWFNNYGANFGSLCTNDGVSYEVKVKFLDIAHTGDAFYLHFGVMTAVFVYSPGVLYINRPAFFNNGAWDTLANNTVVDTSLHPILDWMTFKLIVKPNKYQLYYNGNLALEYARNPAYAIGNLNALGVGMFGRYGAVDHVRVGDANDNVKYYEDFNDVNHPAAVDSSFICAGATDCRLAFKNYYNTKKGTSYTYNQLDSLYEANGLVLDACPIDTGAIRCDQLEKYVSEYKAQYITPSSGFVDLDMRTFAGNKTPDQGPKGVFDVKGKLLGNTIDSTPTLVKESYVKIWNKSPDNRAIGTLALLNSGKFRLTLNPGKQAPCEGIIGQRYYQFDIKTRGGNTVGFGTTAGSYVDFGDSTYANVLHPDTSYAKTTVAFIPGTSWDDNGRPRMGAFFENKEFLGADYVPLKRLNVSHSYTQTVGKTTYTVTVYHTDYKGHVLFGDGQHRDSVSLFFNVRGYFPQNLLDLMYAGTRDSTLNTTKNIRNFNSISTIQNVDIESAGPSGGESGVYPNNFGNFSNNHGLKRIRLEPGLQGITNTSAYQMTVDPLDSTLIAARAGKFFSENFPNFDVNFPEMRTIMMDSWYTRERDYFNFRFQLPKLSIAWFILQIHPPGFVDSLYNQIARVATIDSGNFIVGYPNFVNPPTSASSAAKTKLINMGWGIEDGVSNIPGRGFGDDISIYDTIPDFSSFSEFINAKLNTNLTRPQVDSFYLRKCGHLPDCCSVPDSSLSSTLMLCGKNEAAATYTIDDIYDPPCSDSALLANNAAEEIYAMYKDSLDQSFNQKYTAKCLGAAAIESLTVDRKFSEYHYTLYYYDQAGNLIKTVAPAGVMPVRRPGWLDSVVVFRKAGQTIVPGHTMPTIYRYNSLNQVVSQKTPDAGKTTNWYDKLGRLAISQNAKQVTESKYSYTIYDQLGRITEVGQKYQTTAMTSTISRDTGSLANWIYYNTNLNAYPAEMVTQTVYDVPGVDVTTCPTSLRFTQKGYTLRNRVSYTRYYEKPSYYYDAGSSRYLISGATYTTGIDYSYDIHGNVDTMRNLYNAITYSPITYHGYNNCKTIAYKYDLISGKVNEVHYNPGQNDEFYHRYLYDAENRLTDVYTTDTKIFVGQPGLEERDAKYTYYQHGPLARMTLGQQVVQGIDYAYTLQGWLKGVNSTANSATLDMGGDGTGANFYNGRDAYSYTLYYFNGDYNSINYSQRPFAEPKAYFPSGEYRALYNGNIASMGHNIPARFFAQLYNYRYDQLNRITEMDMYRGLVTNTNLWSSLVKDSLYKERYSYDANGNIKTVLRNGNLSASLLMDSLTYFYQNGTNKLDYIRDKNAGSTTHNSNYGTSIDIKDQSSANYVYNEIGELNFDRISVIDSIKWNVYGKMQHMYKRTAPGSNATALHYYYDPSGNRMGKGIQYNSATNAANTYTWYVRDAQGNTMAVYQATGGTLSTIPLKLKEHHLYGSSRLGIINRDMDVDQARITPDNSNTNLGSLYLATFTRGDKLFELTNHLGNVLLTVTDGKVPTVLAGSSPATVGSYSVNMITATDYTPFGMVMLGRNYNTVAASKYRYGFNGKEFDNEPKSLGNQVDYDERMYDNRVGRFLSVDKLTKNYPWNSPYSYAEGDVIRSIDVDGLERYIVNNYYDIDISSGTPQLKLVNTEKHSNWDDNSWAITKWYFGGGTELHSYLNQNDGSKIAFYGPDSYDRLENYVSNPLTPEEQSRQEMGMAIAGYVLANAFESGKEFGGGYAGKAAPADVVNNQAKPTPTANVNEQTSAAHSGNSSAAQSNRPTWQQSEADILTPDYRPQVSFKNGKEVPKNTRGSVRPEGYKPGASLEVKNYNLTTEQGIKSMINNVVKQVRQRQSNLPKNTVQNITLDVRGQNLNTRELMKVRSRLMTQAGSKNVNINFKTD